MNFAGPAYTLETIEKKDSILFRTTVLRRWIDLLPSLVIMIGVFLLTARLGVRVTALAGLGVAGLSVLQWLSPSKIHSLFVTEYQLVSSEAGTVRWCQIYDVTYIRGGEDQPTGLFAQGPSSDVFLLGLNEEDTLAVITAIYAKFPYPTVMPSPDDPFSNVLDGIPILGGNASALITLNLSNPKDPKA